MSAGQTMPGGVLSTNTMCWTHVEALPQASVAFQVRSIPGLPVQLAAVGASEWVIVTELQASVAVADPVLPGSVAAPHSRFLSGGQTRSGGCVSLNEMIWT